MEECGSIEIAKNNNPVRLRCAVQNYDWGIVGNNSQVARLFSLNSRSSIDSTKPYAEFWIGTHESGPSFIHHGAWIRPNHAVSLKSWISQHPGVLGDKVVEKWGVDLPFLLKVCFFFGDFLPLITLFRYREDAGTEEYNFGS